MAFYVGGNSMPPIVSRAKGRCTRKFRDMRAKILATSTICAYCGHDGSDSVDHVEPKHLRPDLAEVEENLVPAHNFPCPTCGQRCNRVKGTKSLTDATFLRTSQNWF